MRKQNQTYNPCDDCQYSYSKNGQESRMCEICEFAYYIDRRQSENAVEFPCKVGDAVWLVYTPKWPADPADKGKWFMLEDGVQRLIYGVKGISIETWNMGTISAKEIGKKLFLIQEEAEKALAKMKGGTKE